MPWWFLAAQGAALLLVAVAIVKAQLKWLMWRRSHITQKELARLAKRWRGAQRSYSRQYQEWQDGRRSVCGLEDLRASLDEFREVIELLMKGA